MSMDPTQPSDDFRSGFVAIVGAPNAGKSTLLNRMLGQKITITSKKPQTTRNRILGVVHRPAAQIVFLDTPGIHEARGELNTRIVETAVAALTDVDLILVLVDVEKPDARSESLLLKHLQTVNRPVILALNKIDSVKKADLLPAIDAWSKIEGFETMMPISAKHGTQVDELVAAMASLLPPGPPFFPEESLTDHPMRFIAAEMIREKVFRLTGEEIPYATAVTVEQFKEKPDGSLATIHATVHVERDSQKGIIIGKRGSKLKRIGEDARKEIEQMLGRKVFLKLFVRVQKNWSRDTRALRRFGY
jgi:GTPase